MEERGLIVREPNPADARSVMVCLLPAGRRAIEDAAPQHVHNVRRHFIDLFTPAELDTLAALNERVLRHLAEEPFPEQSTPDVEPIPARPLSELVQPVRKAGTHHEQHQHHRRGNHGPYPGRPRARRRQHRRGHRP
jgi:hypothetical protein